VRGRVNHVTVEQAQDTPSIVLDTLPINFVPAMVLFFRSITFIRY
jgi:hypothetical protein